MTQTTKDTPRADRRTYCDVSSRSTRESGAPNLTSYNAVCVFTETGCPALPTIVSECAVTCMAAPDDNDHHDNGCLPRTRRSDAL